MNWDAIKPILGQVPDSVIAKQYGVSRQAVAAQRQKWDIPACMGVQTTGLPDVDADDLRLMSMHQLMKKYRLSYNKVRMLRERAGIRKSGKAQRVIKDLVASGAIKDLNDVTIARLYGLSVSAVAKNRLKLGIKRT